jgi:hypothetical protein
MIPKSGYRFSEKIMLKQEAKAKWRFNPIPFRFSPALRAAAAHAHDTGHESPNSASIRSGAKWRQTGSRHGGRPEGRP